MNLKPLIALSALAFAGSAALAQEITYVKDDFVAQKTRVEVRQELLQARVDGTLPVHGEGEQLMAMPRASTVSRDKVRAELRSSPRTTMAQLYTPG